MNNTPKYTPGPWVIRYKDTVYAQSGRFIADCELAPYDARPQPPNSTDAANAHLIAAAPAMYAALKAIQAWSFGQPWPCREMKQFTDIDAALAQAEGRG